MSRTLVPAWRHAARAAAIVMALAASSASIGCRPLTVVDRAQSDYEGGDYQGAVDRLDDAETLYTNGELPPDYAMRYLAYRGLAYYRLAKETNNKAFRRKGRPFARRALDNYNKSEQAKAEAWLDPAIVAELEEVTKQTERAGGAADEGPAAGP